ncbi:MAG: 1,4-alpha-glucan branching protein GlgB [Myxococcota bacterium]
MDPTVYGAEPFGDHDRHLFAEGTHHRLHHRLGARPIEGGYLFRVWAPSAASVAIIGEFNGWDPQAHGMVRLGDSGVWEGVVLGIDRGQHYKFRIRSAYNGHEVDKTDPFGWFTEPAPGSASITWHLDYDWHDAEWMARRKVVSAPDAPMSIYELHLGSWRRQADGGFLSYAEAAPRLVEHVRRLGFTHVELMPVTEHPFYPSWGYQTTGYFAATSRYGTPQELMQLIDTLHQAGIAVILDWVPGHFPTDANALAFFDGTHLFEHADPRQGLHPEWGSAIFNYGRNEVRSFLHSNAVFWLERYHIDGLRVDAVASMLYLDYGRQDGEWVANRYGGRENLEAVEFLKRFNQVVHLEFPDVVTFAEESTAWPGVTASVDHGGLGFDYKWDLGWMNDSLEYFASDPLYRSRVHEKLTFRPMYAWSERFVLPLSHDEVVHGKGSLLRKMPGDDWQRFANLRLLYAKMFAEPGKKLLFMGAELATWNEWWHDEQLAWSLLETPTHRGVERLIVDLNRLYRSHPALHQLDAKPEGFEWVGHQDTGQSVTSFLRRDEHGNVVLGVFNHTPVPRTDYRVGVPWSGVWTEILNTDASDYGGSGLGNAGAVRSLGTETMGFADGLALTLPPLAALYFESEPPS